LQKVSKFKQPKRAKTLTNREKIDTTNNMACIQSTCKMNKNLLNHTNRIQKEKPSERKSKMVEIEGE